MKILYVTKLKEVQFSVFQTVARQYQHEVHLVGGTEDYRYNREIVLHEPMKTLTRLESCLIKLHLLDRQDYFLQKGLSKLVPRMQPDIIHAVGAHRSATLATSAGCSRPVIITCQGSDVFRFPFQNKKVFDKVQNAFKRADLIHVLSNETAMHLRDAFNVPLNKIVPIHWGIDLQTIDRIIEGTNPTSVRGQLGIADDDRVIFCPRGCRTVFARPIENFLRAVEPLLHQHDDIKVIFMMHGSDEDLKKRIKSYCRNHRIEDRMIYIEQLLPYQDMIILFQSSDITVSLAESDETSTAVLEAMYCGTIPIISNTLTYTNRFKGENVIFVDNDDILKLQYTLDSVLADMVTIKSWMTSLNRELIRKDYNREQSLEQIQGMYDRVAR